MAVAPVELVGKDCRSAGCPPATITRSVSLEDLGFSGGVSLKDGPASAAVYFPVGSSLGALGGELRLDYEAFPLSGQYSYMEVLVNGALRHVVPLGSSQGPRHLRIPLRATDLQGPFVELILKTTFAYSDNYCLDLRLHSGHVAVSAGSSLTYEMPASVRQTVSGYWQTLPRDVIISISNQSATADSFRIFWRIGEILRSLRYRVRFVRLPELGDIVIAPRAEIRRLNGTSLPDKDVDANLQVVSWQREGRSGTFLAVSDPYTKSLEALMDAPWIRLARRNRHMAYPPSQPSPPAKLEPIHLRDLGIISGVLETVGTASWVVSLSPWVIPPHSVPRRIELSVVAPPVFKESKGTLSVFINGSLLEVNRLAVTGKPQRFSVTIPRRLLAQQNEIRILAQLVDSLPLCTTGNAPTVQSIGLDPDSFIVLDVDRTEPARFAELSRYLGDSFEVHVAGVVRDSPVPWVSLLSRLTVDLQLLSQNARVVFDERNSTPVIRGPFVALGPSLVEGAEAPVVFENGRVRLRPAGLRGPLEMADATGPIIAQLVRYGGHSGLMVQLTDTNLTRFAQAFPLSQGDLAFLDESRILLAATVLRDQAPPVEWAASQAPAGPLASWTVRLLLLLAGLCGLTAIFWVYRRRGRARA